MGGRAPLLGIFLGSSQVRGLQVWGAIPCPPAMAFSPNSRSWQESQLAGGVWGISVPG